MLMSSGVNHASGPCLKGHLLHSSLGLMPMYTFFPPLALPMKMGHELEVRKDYPPNSLREPVAMPGREPPKGETVQSGDTLSPSFSTYHPNTPCWSPGDKANDAWILIQA